MDTKIINVCLGQGDTGCNFRLESRSLVGVAGLQAWGGAVSEAGEGGQHRECRGYGPLILQHGPFHTCQQWGH